MGTPTSSSSDPTPGQAAGLYLEALAGVGWRGVVDVEGLARAHPECAEELHLLHETWQRAAALREATRPPSTLGTLARLEAQAARSTRYEGFEEVGRGGMGAVFKVWDPDLRRSLAMKVLHREQDARAGTPPSEPVLARFLEEAQITGQLDHPGVVPVHELGLDAEGQVYFTMRLVRGDDLQHVIELVHARSGGWTFTRAVQVVLKVAEAMAYAHDKGVLHRDLKPANVMVGRFGEVYVVDWGLARVLERDADQPDVLQSVAFRTERTEDAREHGEPVDSTLHTQFGEVLGTPAYMPPEQAKGDLDRLDARSDVYSLGAILYHVLAGHPPYLPEDHGLDAIGVWQRVVEGPPEPLAERAPRAPAELVAVAEKAMAHRRKDRYSTMQELADDLHAYLDGKVVRAYESGALAELRKWVRRNRATAVASAAAILVLLGGLGAFAWWQARFNLKLEKKNVELAVASAEIASERDAGERVIQYLIGLFESPDPRQARGAEVTAKELLDRGAATIDAYRGEDSLVWARLMGGIGGAYHSLGLYDEAEPLLRATLEHRRAELGEAHPETLAALGELVRVTRSAGRYDEAEGLARHALEMEQRLFDAGDVRTLAAQGELGLVLFHQGTYGESEGLLRSALEGQRSALGADDPATLETQSNLARLYRKQARYDEALPLLEEALERRRATLGDDHPDTLKSMNDLAGVHLRARRAAEALPLFQEALAGRRRVLGEEHPETLITLNDLAVLYRVDGRPDLAEPLYLDALEGYRNTLGEDHPNALALLANLASLYQTQGRYDEAEPLLLLALEGNTRARGAEHPNTLSAMNSLAQLHATQGRADEAEALWLEALELHREALGDDHPNTLTLQDNLASFYADQGRWSDAEVLVTDLVARTPRDDPEYAERRELLSEVLAGGDE